MDKLLILSDMEGAYSVYNELTSEKEKKKYKKVIKETLKIATSFDIEVYYCDVHNNGEIGYELAHHFRNIYFFKNAFEVDYDVKYDYFALIGFHGMEGASGFFPHSFSKEIQNIYIGNQVYGEIGVYFYALITMGIIPILINCDKGAQNEINKIKELDKDLYKVNYSKGMSKGIIENVSSHFHWLIFKVKFKKILKCRKKIFLNKNNLRVKVIFKDGSDFEYKNCVDFIKNEKMLNDLIQEKKFKRRFECISKYFSMLSNEVNLPDDIISILNKDVCKLSENDFNLIKTFINIVK